MKCKQLTLVNEQWYCRQRGQNLDNFWMPIKCCMMNWSKSKSIKTIRVFCQRRNDCKSFVRIPLWLNSFDPIQSFLFSIERCLNFLNQKIGFCKICWQDWLICAQIFKSSTCKFQKTFSARCWRPVLVMIFSILDDIW